MLLSDAEARIAAQEEQLIAQIAAGNIEEPLKVLCRRYEKDLYRFGVQMLGDEGLAGEMVEESFQRLWRSAARYDSGRDSPGTFLFMIARSAAASIRECRPSRAPLPPDGLQLPLLPDSVDQILDSLMIRESLGKLSSPHAEVLRLALEDGLTQSEVAERLGVLLETVKIQTFHGIQAMRSALGEQGRESAENQADLAHPEAADWMLGALPPAGAEEFQRHLTSCGHCQLAVTELGRIGRILRHLPPAVEPPPGLEARIVAGIRAAAAKPGPPVPRPHIQLPPPELASVYRTSPGTHRPLVKLAEDEPAEAAVKVNRPVRPRRRYRRYAATGVVAVAATAAALVFLPGISGSTSAEAPAVTGSASALSLVVIPLHSTSGTATSGRATARHLPGGWSIQLTVTGLEQLAPGEFYECWYSGARTASGHPILISAGTFTVGRAGSADVLMRTAADPAQFRTIEITAESRGEAGQQSQVILSGAARP